MAVFGKILAVFIAIGLICLAVLSAVSLVRAIVRVARRRKQNAKETNVINDEEGGVQ